MTVNGKPIKLGGGLLNVSPPDPEIYVTPSEITGVSYLGTYYDVNVCGRIDNSVTVADACTWIVTTSPVQASPSPGTLNTIQVCENITSSCRCGVVCYTPSLGGTMKCVTICQSTGSTDITLNCYAWTGTSAVYGDGATLPERVCGLVSNSTTVSTNCSWIHATTPVSPSASPGTLHNICIDANTVCACRCGTICFTPTAGTMKTVTICQKECITWKTVDYYLRSETGAEGFYMHGKWICLIYNPARSVGDCYDFTFYWDGCVCSADYYGSGCVYVCCNNTLLYNCTFDYNDGETGGMFNRCVDYNDCIDICVCVCDGSGGSYMNCINASQQYISNCASSSSQFCNGTTCQYFYVTTLAV